MVEHVPKVAALECRVLIEFPIENWPAEWVLVPSLLSAPLGIVMRALDLILGGPTGLLHSLTEDTSITGRSVLWIISPRLWVLELASHSGSSLGQYSWVLGRMRI